ARYHSPAMSSPIEIVGYRPEFREAFESLNREWLERYALIEPVDVEHLQKPEEHILRDGGQVFFAVQGSAVVGTCAAVRKSEDVFELAKLTVASSARGHGLGRRLCEVVVSYAREAGASEIVLSSNTQLVDAIHLYEALGFQHAPIPDDMPYETADVFMKLAL
ncbi:MAG TPA: GNAT family N-acetyltransferase, partial [Thermoanaerobaculia bacterium]|nr:GNAT family N-acetyltransferase [Thermoanaerobaculia bacterium]